MFLWLRVRSISSVRVVSCTRSELSRTSAVRRPGWRSGYETSSASCVHCTGLGRWLGVYCMVPCECDWVSIVRTLPLTCSTPISNQDRSLEQVDGRLPGFPFHLRVSLQATWHQGQLRNTLCSSCTTPYRSQHSTWSCCSFFCLPQSILVTVPIPSLPPKALKPGSGVRDKRMDDDIENPVHVVRHCGALEVREWDLRSADYM